MTDTSSPPKPLRLSVPLTAETVAPWLAKGCEKAAALLPHAGEIADPAPVASRLVKDSKEWIYGQFMTAWLDGSGKTRHVCHIADAGFFLRLLDRCYGPVFNKRPELRETLIDDSRPEMSMTNDALQIQLNDGLGDSYGMIRNHALMLFISALWLDEPQRTRWLDLYDEIVTYVDSREGGRPSAADAAEVEAAAFADFTALAPRTIDSASAAELLSGGELDAILEYQLLCAFAIGLLWRDYRARSSDEDREAWLSHHLADLYRTPDYLIDLWMENDA